MESRVITPTLVNIQTKDKCVRNVINLFIGLLIMMTLLKLNSMDLVTNGIVITRLPQPDYNEDAEPE